MSDFTGLPPQLPALETGLGQSASSSLTKGHASLTDSSGRALPPPDDPPSGISVVSKGASGDNSGSLDWRSRYRDQAVFVRAMRCPRCGDHGLVPILYGFPSPPLMEARKARKMILGGDHLIEDCHVWACTTCNLSFR